MIHKNRPLVSDLSHTIDSVMPVFPGTQPPSFESANTLENDGFVEVKLTMYSHTGTHIDAPAHMFATGLTLDQLAIEHYIGSGVIIDCSGSATTIELDLIKPYQHKIAQADFVIIKTGWSRYWGQAEYYQDFPAISTDVASWLTDFPLKGVGVDAISIDASDSVDFPVHKTLLQHNILIIENLTNLESIKLDKFILSVLPLKTKQADGSPVRAVAIENI